MNERAKDLIKMPKDSEVFEFFGQVCRAVLMSAADVRVELEGIEPREAYRIRMGHAEPGEDGEMDMSTATLAPIDLLNKESWPTDVFERGLENYMVAVALAMDVALKEGVEGKAGCVRQTIHDEFVNPTPHIPSGVRKHMLKDSPGCLLAALVDAAPESLAEISNTASERYREEMEQGGGPFSDLVNEGGMEVTCLTGEGEEPDNLEKLTVDALQAVGDSLMEQVLALEEQNAKLVKRNRQLAKAVGDLARGRKRHR